MSRLQVGGLALVINDQFDENLMKTVQLTGYRGDVYYDGKIYADCWYVYCEDGLVSECTEGGGFSIEKEAFTPSAWLMPLGDKQTQDELAKEQEKELV